MQIVRIKPDMLNEFIDLEKNEVVPALKKGGTKSRTVYQAALFGNSFEFAIVTPFERFAEFDGDEAQFKALGATASARLGEKLRKCILDADSFLFTRADDLSNLMTGTTSPAMIVIVRYRVAPGRMQEFESLIKTEVLPGFRKAKMALTVNHRGMGANPNDITFTTFMTKYAEMDLGSPPVRALGQETVTKLGPRVAALATNIDTVIRRLVPDLSF